MRRRRLPLLLALVSQVVPWARPAAAAALTSRHGSEPQAGHGGEPQAGHGSEPQAGHGGHGSEPKAGHGGETEAGHGSGPPAGHGGAAGPLRASGPLRRFGGDCVLACDCPRDYGATATAIGLLFVVVVIPIVIFMALSPGPISDLVLKLVDTSISIFLAVLWFSAFSGVMDSQPVHRLFPFAEEVFVVVQVLVLYTLVMAVAYVWRDKELRLAAFGGCGAHYVAFAGIHATGEVQHEASKFSDETGHWWTFLVAGASFLILALVFRASHLGWLRPLEHPKLDEAVEDIELDIIALTCSFAITQALRHALTGRYPEHHASLLQQALAPSPQVAAAGPAALQLAGCDGHRHTPGAMHEVHEAWQRWFMLIWSLGLTAVAAVCLKYINAIGEYGGRYARKAAHLTRAMLVMCIAWGYLLWGEWVFNEVLFVGEPVVALMSFAVLTTLISLALISGLAQMDVGLRPVRQTVSISVTGASLVAAWSWERCFDAALDIIGERYQVGYGGLVPKVALAFSIPLAILPVYVTYIKPRVMEAERREDLQQHADAEAVVGSLSPTTSPSH